MVLSLSFPLLSLCVCTYAHGYAHHGPLRKSQTACSSQFSPFTMSVPGIELRGMRVGGKLLCLLSHLTSPFFPLANLITQYKTQRLQTNIQLKVSPAFSQLVPLLVDLCCPCVDTSFLYSFPRDTWICQAVCTHMYSILVSFTFLLL